MSDTREDYKRQTYEDRLASVVPESCGCSGWVSACCGASPWEYSDVATDNLAGICGQCHENTGFESQGDKDTWKLIMTTTYGDDADGRRGVPLHIFECTYCGNEEEVLG